MNEGSLLNRQDVSEIDKNKTLVINKSSKNYQVYRIPLRYLYYNDKNDRISTEFERFTSEGNDIDPSDREAYNMAIEKIIASVKPEYLRRTKNSISNRGQDNPGVVLDDGRVVDGNRRFTCLRMIERETKKPQYFEAVILNYGYEHDYKLIKSLELELQMGVEEKVPYDPIDRIYGVYKSIRVEQAFTVDEYAALFDDRTVKDVKKDLEIADLMCEYLDFIKCPGQFHIAKDMKLDGVLEEMPGILANVRKTDADMVEDVKYIIFSAIVTGASTTLNQYVRNEIGKLVKNKEDLTELVQSTQEAVDEVIDEIESRGSMSEEEINEIRKDVSLSQNLSDSISTQNNKVNNRSLQDAPLKMASEAYNKLNSIVIASIPSMRPEAKDELRRKLDSIQKKMDELRNKLDS